MHLRSALLAPFAVFGLTGLTLSAVAAGCRHDRPEPTPVAVLPEAGAVFDSTESAPPPTVLENGSDVDADLSCLPALGGTPRADVGIMFDEVGTPGDTATAADADEAGSGSDAELPDVSADAATSPGDAGAVPVGTMVDKEIELIAFGSGGNEKLPNQQVDVYFYNTFMQAPDVTGLVSDANGLVRLKLPHGVRVGYHVKASTLLGDFYGLDDLHVPLGGATKPRWQGVTRERQNTLAQAVTGEASYVLPPGTGIVSGRVMDCQRRTIQSVAITLRDMDANKNLDFVKCGTGLCLLYLSDSELPNLGLKWTSRSALFAMIDVPVGRKIRMIATANLAGKGPTEIGHRDLEPKNGAIGFQVIEPDNH